VQVRADDAWPRRNQQRIHIKQVKYGVGCCGACLAFSPSRQPKGRRTRVARNSTAMQVACVCNATPGSSGLIVQVLGEDGGEHALPFCRKTAHDSAGAGRLEIQLPAAQSAAAA
jgi:hypothetical protein